MKITVTKKALADALGLLARLIPPRSTNPLLTSLLMEADDSNIYLSGTNLEADMRVRVDAEVQDATRLAVPAHLFHQLVSQSAGELVSLYTSDTELHFESAGQKAVMQTTDVAAYPELTFPPLDDAKQVHAKPLAEALAAVRYAVGKDNYQTVFRGVYFEIKADRQRVVASDSYRVAFAGVDTGLGPCSLIVPHYNVDKLLDMLKTASDVSLGTSYGTLHARSERVQLNVKLLDGEFPEYERVIPANITLTARCNAAELSEALKRVSLFADKNANNRVDLMVQGMFIQVKAEGDYGSNEDTVTATLGGTEDALAAAFNARYLLEALSPIEGEVEIQFSGSTQPAVFAPQDGSGYRGILVALRQ